MYSSFALAALFVSDLSWFWVLSNFAALWPGITLASSRSLLCQLAPKKNLTTMFGLYGFVGELSTMLGPLFLASITSLASSQRVGLASTAALILVGGALLFWLPTPSSGDPL